MVHRLRGFVWFVAAMAAPAGADPADKPDPPAAPAAATLAARGLTRVGDRFVLPDEERIKRRLDQLQALVAANQEALRRRALRSVITGQSQSLLADLQAWRLSLNALNASSPWPGTVGMGPGIGPREVPNSLGIGGLGDLADLNQQQINNMFNVVAGVEADNAFEAAEALARQDDFDRALGGVRRAIEALGPAYRAVNADPAVPDALGTLARAENKPIGLGPLADHARTLELLERGMDTTRRLTTPKGATTPDYGVAANLAQGARLKLRMALGRLQEWEGQAASNPGAPNATLGESLRREVARGRDRYVHSVALLRRAYNAYRPPPFVHNKSVEPVPEPAEPGRIRALVERRRAEIRASFVKEAERALTTARVPLEISDDGGLWATLVVNDVPGRRMRVEPSESEVRVSRRLAEAVGLKADPTTGQGVLRSVRIGSFTIRNVRCRVLPEDDADATAVLGAPALADFVADLSEWPGPPALFLTRVNVEPIAPRPRPAGAPPAKLQRRTK